MDRDWTNKLSTAALIGVLARCVTILIRLGSLPLILAFISPDRYGLWLIVLSVVGWLSISDLGIPAALQNRLVGLEAKGCEERRHALVAYAVRLLFTIGATLAVVGMIVSFIFPWSRVFGVAPDAVPEFRWSLIVCLLAFAVSLPTRIGGALFNAHGRIALPPLVDIISQVGSFGVLLLALVKQWSSIVVLAVCNLSGIVIGPLAALFVALAMFGYKPWKMGRVDPEDRRALLTKGLFFFLAVTGELLVLQTDAFVIAFVLGPEAVPRYLIPATLFINFLMLQNTLLRPLWPLLTKRQAAGEFTQVRHTIAWLLRWSIFGALVAGVGFVVAGDWFIRLWSHRAAGLPPAMAWGMAAYVLVASVDNVLATVLNAFGLIEVRLRFTIAHGVVKVLAAFAVLHVASIDYLPIVYACVILLVSVPWAARALIKTLAERTSAVAANFSTEVAPFA